MESTLTPYLNFNGNAGEAMKFYHAVLGGDLKMQTFGEMNMAQNPADKERIIHAVLKSGAITFMASDTMPERLSKAGDNVHMSLSGQDNAKLTEIFSALSAGGKVDMPLAKQFWGDTYGQLTDKFGIHWMVNITNPQQTQ